MKRLNIYRKFSEDFLLQDTVSQPRFDSYSNMKCQSLKKILLPSAGAGLAQGQNLVV